MKLFVLIALLPLLACAREAAPAGNSGTSPENAAAAPASGNAPQSSPANDNSGSAQNRAEAPSTPPAAAERRAAPTPGRPDSAEADQCGASRYQWLVGRPRSAIPARPAGANWRVACTGCPITMDYSPARLNIFYDQETERIDEVRCG